MEYISPVNVKKIDTLKSFFENLKTLESSEIDILTYKKEIVKYGRELSRELNKIERLIEEKEKYVELVRIIEVVKGDIINICFIITDKIITDIFDQGVENHINADEVKTRSDIDLILYNLVDNLHKLKTHS